MRIGLNATCFNARPSGARQRFLGLYGALIAAQPETEFVVYDPVDAPVSQWLGNHPNIIPRQTPIPSSGRVRKALAARGYWRDRLRADRLDLFEQFNLPLVKAPDCPTLLTVHDIRDAHEPRLLRPLYRAIWHRALAAADHVITVSDTMRRELLAFHPGAAVTTIHNGIDPAPLLAAADMAQPQDYLLAVGHIESRKNYRCLVAAMALLNRGDAAVDLVLVGRDGGEQAAIEQAIAVAGLDARISIRSDVDDAALARLYANCRFVVFPSLYEGFGIPVLEAMAARRPLVLSELPVFREIAGDAAEYFDPTDPTALALAIERASAPQHAAALVSAGATRLHDFAFPHLAQQLAELHAEMLR